MTEEQPHPTATLFDALSATYDTSGVAFFRPIADGLLAEMPPRPGERWLDVGCGPGAVTLPAAEAVGPGGSVVGVDISPLMVQRCLDSAAQDGLDNVAAVVGDAAAPPVDGTFDVIASSLVLFFLPDPAAALRAWLPLLRPGGRLGVVTFGPVDSWWHSLDEVLRPYLPPQMDGARSGHEGPFGSDAGMERLVSAAGYIRARTVAWDLPVRFASPEQYHAWSMGTAQRVIWSRIPDHEQPSVRARVEELLGEHGDADGSVTLTQGVRITLASRA